MAEGAPAPTSYSVDPTLYLYTSLTAGSSHIITATSRLETILKANKIPFRALDVATDEKARMLWGRRSKGKKLPGLVRFGSIVGDLDEVEEWNEYGELKQQIGATAGSFGAPVPSTNPTPSKEVEAPAPAAPSPIPKPSSERVQFKEPPESERRSSVNPPKIEESPMTLAMRQAGAEAAAKAGEKKLAKQSPLASEGTKPPAVETAEPETQSPSTPKSLETPLELVATRTPTQLAAEGARRTSIDKIAEVENTEPPGIGRRMSREENLLQIRERSSLTKIKTPLSHEAGLGSPPSPEPRFEQRPREHRGSSVSEASREEIALIEKARMIVEEDEDEEE